MTIGKTDFCDASDAFMIGRMAREDNIPIAENRYDREKSPLLWTQFRLGWRETDRYLKERQK